MNTALFDIVEKHRIDAANVRKVRIALSQAAFDMHGGFGTYKAKFEALLSAHYTAAVILHDRALTLAQFEPDRYDDPKLRRFAAEKVEVRADASITGSQAKVDVDHGRRRDLLGALRASARVVRRIRCRVARSSKNSAATPRASSPDAHIADVIAAVDRLEDFGSVRRLMDLLRGGAARPCDGGSGVIYSQRHRGDRSGVLLGQP